MKISLLSVIYLSYLVVSLSLLITVLLSSVTVLSLSVTVLSLLSLYNSDIFSLYSLDTDGLSQDDMSF